MLFYTRDPVTIQLLRTLSAKTFLIYHFFLVVLRPTLPFRTVVSLVEDSSKLRDVFFVQENNN